ncbi:MAG: PDDEXK nuclease domain-containing protein [Bifidobacteriaceae bacterium]|jgi:predicted nuclease of restriction endonuclease-like (RecB) superfamily|nr:PDDEXK nuclease domain-containing protein [Bifidobacteriaceae bacterium]
MSLPERIVPRALEEMPPGYAEWLVDLKARVRATQFRAARAASAEVIRLYLSVGRDILERQEVSGWGAGVIPQLSQDMKREFPGQTGWSPTNLIYMRKAAKRWPRDEISQQLVVKLPWGHIVTLLDKTDTVEDLLWYAQGSVENGWSRAVLAFQITSGLKQRLGAPPSNFADALTPPDSDLAQQMTKDPYVFQHVGLVHGMAEHDLEQALIDRIQDTLLELGRGITLAGRQVRLTVDGVDRYLDLLMFHTEQLRYIVIELKTTNFEPEHLGALSTYVMMVDGLVRNPAIHAPTVGLLLCTGKREGTVRFALAGTAAPLAVAEWQGLPEDAQAALPSVEELEAVVQNELAHQMALHGGSSAPEPEPESSIVLAGEAPTSGAIGQHWVDHSLQQSAEEPAEERQPE